ncbi:MAG: FliH/SctL family protein [Bdellovibrionia bacterium]
MSDGKMKGFKVTPESKSTAGVKVSEVNSGFQRQVGSFEVISLKNQQTNRYDQIKQKFGPLAVTDPDRAMRALKDRRFSLNPLLKEPLSVEEEEKRVFDEKLKQEVEQIREDVKTRAQQEGYEEGVRQGREEGYSQVRLQVDEEITHLQQLMEQLESARSEIFRLNEKFLIGLIFKISRMVLLRELSLDREFLSRLTLELVEGVGVRDHVTVKINSEDEGFIGMLRQDLLKRFGELKNLKIEVSPEIARGGCRVETEYGSIDSNLEQQLQRIEEALLEHKSDDRSDEKSDSAQ